MEKTEREIRKMKGVGKVEYAGKRQKRAHEETEHIFRELFPKHGLNVREGQLLLSHEMLDTLWGKRIALCDAGVGIGKTYAYLVACTMWEKYPRRDEAATGIAPYQPAVISTSSIALQDAILKEYIPFLSRVLLEEGIIRMPLKAVVRKGKEHFVCDSRLKLRLAAIEEKKKNEKQKAALLSLKTYYDLDQVHDLSGFDRRLVSVPKSCPKNCTERRSCRYRRYMGKAKNERVHFQICNHNYLLADAYHRVKGYRPLLADYKLLVADEAHKLSEAAGQMCGKRLGYEDILEICFLLEREHQGMRARRLKAAMDNLFETIAEENTVEDGKRIAFRKTERCGKLMEEGASLLYKTAKRCKGSIPKWLRSWLEEYAKFLCRFLIPDRKYILYLELCGEGRPVLCTADREIPGYLREMLWKRGFPAILTSGTLKAGNDFRRTRKILGLDEIDMGKKAAVQEYTAASPFAYAKNCLLYLPKDSKKVRHGSRREILEIAGQIRQLVISTHGHTLVLFTSYFLMGNVCQILRGNLPFPMMEVWRHAQEEILRFKKQENAVLFAAGACWEGVDFPGDMVSSLIIVRLPFAVPDPVKEAEKEQYGSLREYIGNVVVPDMQKKLKQGFGRAIRTEKDTCVVSVLDYRAGEGGRYHGDVLCALPECQRAGTLEDVEEFIRNRKSMEYYM